jgi:hypothetical protein
VTAVDWALLRVSVPAESLAGMVPGERRRVRVRVDGVPPLVAVEPETDVVTVRLVEQPEEEEQDLR